MDEHAATRVLPAALGGTALVVLVFNAPLTTLMPTASSLGAGPAAQTWIIGAVSLGLSAALLAGGAIGDVYGRARVFTAGAATMALGGVVCAAAADTVVFVAARVLQGIGGAAILACSLGLIGEAFPAGERRRWATGTWGATIGAGIAIGPLVAAGLAEVWGWRSVHAVEAAMAVVVALLGLRLAETRAESPRRVDLLAVLYAALAQAGLVAGLITAREGWDRALPWAGIAAGIACWVLFGRRQHHRTDPLFDLRLLRHRPFTAALIGAAVTGLALIGPLSELPNVLQQGIGLSAIGSSLVLGIWSATSAVVALQAGRIAGRDAPGRQLVVGLFLCGVGMLGCAVLATTGAVWAFVPGLLLAGVGSGLGNASLARLAVETVPAEDAAVGSGANNTMRYLGSSLGVAITATMLPADAVSTPVLQGIRAGFLVAAALATAGAIGAALLAWSTVSPGRTPVTRTRADTTGEPR